MAKASVTETRVTRTEQEQSNGDPIAVYIKSFILDGQDPPDGELEKYELNIKCQKLDRSGRVVQGVALRTNKLLTLFDEILHDSLCGPGRYNVYVQYRPVGETREPSVVRCLDVKVSDGMEAQPYQVSTRVENEPTGGTNLLAFVMQSMQESNKLMIHMMQEQSKQNAAMIATLARGNGSNIDEVLDAAERINGYQGETYPPEGEQVTNPDDPYGLLQMATPVIAEIIKKIIEAKTPEEKLQASEELQQRITAGQQQPPTPQA